jgi:hypothetical protein
MNFLDYLTNAMTGGQPTQQELMMRKMAEEEAKRKALQGLLSQQVPQQLPMQSPYMQGLTNPGQVMQQNYVDPRLIEQMYYKGLLSK